MKTPALAMQQVYALTSAVYFGALEARGGIERGARSAGADRRAADERRPARRRRRSKPFDKKLEAIAAAPAAAGARRSRRGAPGRDARGGIPPRRRTR